MSLVKPQLTITQDNVIIVDKLLNTQSSLGPRRSMESSVVGNSIKLSNLHESNPYLLSGAIEQILQIENHTVLKYHDAFTGNVTGRKENLFKWLSQWCLTV